MHDPYHSTANLTRGLSLSLEPVALTRSLSLSLEWLALPRAIRIPRCQHWSLT